MSIFILFHLAKMITAPNWKIRKKKIKNNKNSNNNNKLHITNCNYREPGSSIKFHRFYNFLVEGAYFRNRYNGKFSSLGILCCFVLDG